MNIAGSDFDNNNRKISSTERSATHKRDDESLDSGEPK